MTDKIIKFLRKLSNKEQQELDLLFMRLKAGDTNGLNIKRLVGLDDMFRVRHGRIRVVFEQKNNIVRIIKVAFRDDATYKGL